MPSILHLARYRIRALNFFEHCGNSALVASRKIQCSKGGHVCQPPSVHGMSLDMGGLLDVGRSACVINAIIHHQVLSPMAQASEEGIGEEKWIFNRYSTTNSFMK